MKFLTVLVALFALTFATTTYADISVSGEGTVSVTPDMASISLAVVTENSVVATAMTKNNDAANRLYDCLADFKIEKKDIQTTDFSVREGYTNEGKPSGTYYVTNEFRITVRKLSNLSAILSALTVDGANRLGGLSYGASNTAEATKQARALAMADAKSKAADLARLSQTHCGRAVHISESSYSRAPSYEGMNRMAAPGGGRGAPLSGGQLTVTVSVSVSYELSDLKLDDLTN